MGDGSSLKGRKSRKMNGGWELIERYGRKSRKMNRGMGAQ